MPHVRATQYFVLIGSVTIFILTGGQFLNIFNGARNLLTQNLKIELESFFSFFLPEKKGFVENPVTEVCN